MGYGIFSWITIAAVCKSSVHGPKASFKISSLTRTPTGILLRTYSQTSTIKKMSKRLLVAFDFDHTLVDDNSDTVARGLLPKGEFKEAEEVYKKTDSWTFYMREVFRLLHNNGVKSDQILNAIRKIPAINNMEHLMQFLNNDECEVIIISDSNSIFIDEWLKSNKMDHIVKKVYTNPAFFDDTGLLNILPYQEQDFCKLSEWNLCKGYVLKSHVDQRKAENVTFKHVAFIGDGSNDLCPSLSLSEGDFVFPRLNYALHKKIIKNKSEVKANIHPWTTGANITDILKQTLTT